ncbi:MAG: GNAT family N-acetyltransferase [Pseudomonadota bacterium]
MTPAEMAALHARCFTQAPPPWSEAAFAEALAAPGALALTRPGACLIARVMGPEAELLTLAVDPDQRRRGLGAALIAEFHSHASAAGAEEAFLEVVRTNHAARALYEAAGYVSVGSRPGYYAGTDALILRKSLNGA